MSKRKILRRRKVAAVARAKTSAEERVFQRGRVTCWLTRSSKDDVVSDNVEVWLTPPKSVALLDGCGVIWLGTREEDGASSFVEILTRQYAEKLFGTTPDDDRMVIRVGNAPVLMTS